MWLVDFLAAAPPLTNKDMGFIAFGLGNMAWLAFDQIACWLIRDR
jgi:hypothetical protein